MCLHRGNVRLVGGRELDLELLFKFFRDLPLDIERFLRRMLGDDTWARMPAVMRRDRRAEGVALVAEMVALDRGGELFDPVAIEVPVLTGHGDRSRPRHREAARLVAAEAPRGELWVIEGAAHPAHYTHAADFARFVGRAAERAG